MRIKSFCFIRIPGRFSAWDQVWPGYLQGKLQTGSSFHRFLFPTIILLIVFIIGPHGKRLAAAMIDAAARDAITPELKAACADPVVSAGHLPESSYAEGALRVRGRRQADHLMK